MAAVATAIATGGALLIAHVTGADAIGRAFDEIVPGWIALIAVAELLTYPAYALAYRSVACVHGHAPLGLPLAARIVAAGFGPFHVAGGFGIDKQALHALHEDERSARVRVLGLGVLEWALLAPTACVVSIVFLIEGADIMPSLLWPWAVAVPVGLGFALWASAPGRRERLARIRGRRRAWLGDLLDGVGVLHELLAHPIRYWGAWVGTALYWAADITAFYAALRTFGMHLDFGKVIIAYATGYAATRRSLAARRCRGHRGADELRALLGAPAAGARAGRGGHVPRLQLPARGDARAHRPPPRRPAARRGRRDAPARGVTAHPRARWRLIVRTISHSGASSMQMSTAGIAAAAASRAIGAIRSRVTPGSAIVSSGSSMTVRPSVWSTISERISPGVGVSCDRSIVAPRNGVHPQDEAGARAVTPS
jgi:uncharacterized membrane protein YbhN (UPF0104 family)